MENYILLEKKYQLLTHDYIIDFEKFNQFAIVHHSNAIEGSTLTLEETNLLLNSGLTPKNKPLAHSLMATDHYNALKYVLALAKEKESLTTAIIKIISSLILKNTGGKISTLSGDFDSSKGHFRKGRVSVGERIFMGAEKVPLKVQELVDFINQKIKKAATLSDIYDLAFDAHFQLVSIHPFADGNGRIARLMMNYIQHFHDKPLTVVFKEDKSDYFYALEQARKQENISYFRNFMKSQATKFFKQEIQRLTTKQKDEKDENTGFSFLF